MSAIPPILPGPQKPSKLCILCKPLPPEKEKQKRARVQSDARAPGEEERRVTRVSERPPILPVLAQKPGKPSISRLRNHRSPALPGKRGQGIKREPPPSK